MCAYHLKQLKLKENWKAFGNGLHVFKLSLGFKHRETRNKWENTYFGKQLNEVKLSLSVRYVIAMNHPKVQGSY